MAVTLTAYGLEKQDGLTLSLGMNHHSWSDSDPMLIRRFEWMNYIVLCSKTQISLRWISEFLASAKEELLRLHCWFRFYVKKTETTYGVLVWSKKQRQRNIINEFMVACVKEAVITRSEYEARSKSNLIELKFGRELHDTTGLKFNGGIEIQTVAVKKWEMVGSKEAIREDFCVDVLLSRNQLLVWLRPCTIGDSGVCLMVGQLILSEYIEEGQYTCVHELKCKQIFMSLRQRLYIKLRGAREVSDVRYFSPDAKVMSKVMSNCRTDMETTANQRITTTSHLELEAYGEV
ncbi:hypothetical protein F2Q68_00015988 [Brassica cretica]|uniref:Uncharacterized protein n=1 Tax=Brassica cretica TaxID=69181 RepID=A0A8S9HH16_BRACR|nr:hypothetical protein F2Q68_00015988 [Brassica cretica]